MFNTFNILKMMQKIRVKKAKAKKILGGLPKIITREMRKLKVFIRLGARHSVNQKDFLQKICLDFFYW